MEICGALWLAITIHTPIQKKWLKFMKMMSLIWFHLIRAIWSTCFILNQIGHPTLVWSTHLSQHLASSERGLSWKLIGFLDALWHFLAASLISFHMYWMSISSAIILKIKEPHFIPTNGNTKKICYLRQSNDNWLELKLKWFFFFSKLEIFFCNAFNFDRKFLATNLYHISS